MNKTGILNCSAISAAKTLQNEDLPDPGPPLTTRNVSSLSYCPTQRSNS